MQTEDPMFASYNPGIGETIVMEPAASCSSDSSETQHLSPDAMQIQRTERTLVHYPGHSLLMDIDEISDAITERPGIATPVASWNATCGNIGLAQVVAVDTNHEMIPSITLETDSGYMIAMPGPAALLVNNSSNRLSLQLLEPRSTELPAYYIPQLWAPIPDIDVRNIQAINVPAREPLGHRATQRTAEPRIIRLNSRFGYYCGELIAKRLKGHARTTGSSTDPAADFRCWSEQFEEFAEPGASSNFCPDLLIQFDQSRGNVWDCVRLEPRDGIGDYESFARFYHSTMRNDVDDIRVPDLTFMTGQRFRIGLAAALMDYLLEDRFVCGPAGGPQQTETVIRTGSHELAYQLWFLFSTLGVRANVYPAGIAGGRTAFVVCIRTLDLNHSGVLAAMTCDLFKRKLESAGVEDTSNAARWADDMIPITSDLSRWFIKLLSGSNQTHLDRATFNMLSSGEIARGQAQRLIKVVEDDKIQEFHRDFKQFSSWVRKSCLRWHRVVAVHESPANRSAKKLVLRGRDNFINAQGFVLPATMRP